MLSTNFISKPTVSNLSSNKSSFYEFSGDNIAYHEWIDNLKVLGEISVPDLDYDFLSRFPNMTVLVKISKLSKGITPRSSDISKLYDYVNSLRRTNISMLWRLQGAEDVDPFLLKIKK